MVEPYVFPGRPTLRAEYGNIDHAGRMRCGPTTPIPVAVASGTLNDIVKRAAHECDRPYMAVATAASVDGYTSFGASITKDGFKQTLTCPAPRAVVADLDVLTAAPGHHDRERVRRPAGQGPGRGRLDRGRRARGRPDRPARLGPGAGPAAGGDRPGRPSWPPATATRCWRSSRG